MCMCIYIYTHTHTSIFAIYIYIYMAKILGRRIEKKIEDVLREDQFGFRRGKGTRDAIGMLRIISE